MSRDRPPGRLVAILHSDVAGCSLLMKQAEDLAHWRVTGAFDRLDAVPGRYGGTVVEQRGDALLAEFPWPLDSIDAARLFLRGAAKGMAEMLCPAGWPPG